MRLGKIQTDGQVFLAPMAGITDLPYRSLCKQMGAAVVYSEMISAKGLFYQSKNTEALLTTDERERPLAVQIFGSEPEIMAEMAKQLEQRGVELLDINMGCPAPKIVRNGEGSALMKDPALIGRIVRAVSGAVTIPVTVKLRKGFDAATINAVACAQIAQENGAAAVTVHGRTRAQQYSGKADWVILRQVKEALEIPLIGNGDVVDGPTARKMLDETGCDAVMIGRASFGNPWIFEQARHYLETGEMLPAPSFAEKKPVILAHAAHLAQIKGERMAVLEMRKHLSWYVKGQRGASKLRGNINQMETLADVAAILSHIGAEA